MTHPLRILANHASAPQRQPLIVGLFTLLIGTLAWRFAVTGIPATLGDDAASYLSLAHYFAPGGSAGQWREFAPLLNHFPPLFPLLLAWTGSAGDIARAQAVVVFGFIACLPLLYAYAARVTDHRGLALATLLLFCVLPHTWLRQLGIMSEMLYLGLSLATLLLAEGRAHWRRDLLLGLGCGLLVLTRTAGFTLLLAALALPLYQGMRSAQWRPAATSLVFRALPAALLLAIWYGLRPGHGSDQHIGLVPQLLALPMSAAGQALTQIATAWQEHFLLFAALSSRSAGVISLLGIWCVAGSIVRSYRGALDGWYVLLSLLLVTVWSLWFPTETARLLYPLVPLLLLHGLWLAQQARLRVRWVGWAAALLFGLAAGLGLLADQLIWRRATTTDTHLGRPLAISREFYQFADVAEARQKAIASMTAVHVFDWMRQHLPADATVMWGQPHYIAVLAQRRGVEYRAAWTQPQLLQHMRRSGASHIVYTAVTKGDYGGDILPPSRISDVFAVAEPVYGVHNPSQGVYDALVVKILRERLPAGKD